MNNYHSYEDENHTWLKKLFKTYEFYFTNLNVAMWIDSHFDGYVVNDYSKISEFHNYTFHDQGIYEYFVDNDFFIGQLVKYSHLVSFLQKELTSPLLDNRRIICRMIEYLLENRFHPDFDQVVRQPEKILFKIKKYHLINDMDEELLSENFEMTLKFHNHDIQTTLHELLEIEDWDDLSNFKKKIVQKEIKLDEILSLNLKSIGEILNNMGFSDGLVDCCICFEIGKKDIYSFYYCSHFICKKCIYQYIASKDLQIDEIDNNGNLFEISLFSNGHTKNSLPCPKCQKESVKRDDSILFFKIYI